MPFNTLIDQYGMHPGQFLTHCSLTHTLHTSWRAATTETPTYHVIQYLHVMGTGRHFVTWLVRAIGEHTHHPLIRLRRQWEEENRDPFLDKEWDRITTYHSGVSRNARFQLLQFFILHRAYMTPPVYK